MTTTLTHNGEKVLAFVTDDLQSVNTIAKKAKLNWHIAARELAILSVLDKVDSVVLKKEKKDQYYYKLKANGVSIY